MKVLSLFDGISAGQVALQRAGIQVDTYYASEIDKYAIKITQNNFPNTIQLGSITEWRNWNIDWSSIDLVFGGSPCQGFSIAGKQLNFDDERSKLFFIFSDILNHIKSLNPNVFFMLENVIMKKEYEDVITQYMGVNPIKINSSLVSAQTRKRLYWTNIPNITQPEDKGILLKDIIINDSMISDVYKLSDIAIDYMNRLHNGRPRWKSYASYLDGKAACLTSNFYRGVPYGILMEKKRRLTIEECEILQTFPINYTSCVSNTQRYKAIGNSWTVDVIAHIFKNIVL
jgi:DNA (cytosine-5)-methyltransferase 3A